MQPVNSKSHQALSNVWSIFAALVIALILLLAGVFLLHFYYELQAEQTRQNSHETLNVGLARTALVEDIATVSTDLKLLHGLLQTVEQKSQNNHELFQQVASLFMTFAQEKGLYDQIRYLNLNGKEVVRVNWNQGQPTVVNPALLQDKSKRYYVRQALRLDKGQIYLSPLDLNIEDGQIETPIKPVLRFAIPFFNVDDQHTGLIVLNYLGNRMLERFRQVSANIADHVQLLNTDGYWLSSPLPKRNWGFMYGQNETFASLFPFAWQIIQRKDQGQFQGSTGLFTYATVFPVDEVSRLLPGQSIPGQELQRWKVVSLIETAPLMTSINAFVLHYWDLYLGILLLLTVLAFLLANGHVHRRRAEAQRAHEQKFRKTLEDVALAALMVDTQGHIIFCNHFLLELTGWRKDEINGKNWIKLFIPQEDQARAKTMLELAAADDHQPDTYESQILTRRGKRRLISWNYTPSRDGEGRISGVTAIGEDITEKREAEEQVRVLSRAVEQSPASVVITSCEGLIEYVNPKFSEVTGYAPEEVLGENPRMLKSGETPSQEYAQLWQALKAGGEWRGEFHNRRKDGSLYWEAAIITALRDLDGRITHFLAVKEDITERKRLEQEVDTRNLELSRAQALTAMGRMASMLAHDLSNPLSSVKMAIQLLGKKSTHADAVELATISQEQINYMENIISEMLAYARPGELETSWLDAEKLLNSVTSTVQKRVLESGASVTIHCTAGLPTFPGDESKLRQSLTNLIVNGLRATTVLPESERTIEVTIDLDMLSSGRHIRFQVCDNGEGISADIADRIFEPFFTTHSKGTGLGLAIVKQITDLHGGMIEFTANQPRGTCALLSLPLTPVVSTWQKAQVNIEGDREST